MAKKKSQGVMAAPMSSGSGGEISSRIEEARNGFIVRLSRENVGKEHRYESHTFVATSRPKALRIAASHLRSAEGDGERPKKGKREKKARSSGR
jgi:hypothetical protein